MAVDPSASLGNIHINELLGRHDFHPYDPNLEKNHPCFSVNSDFYACMSHEQLSDLPLHMKHVKCYHPHKVALMRCLTKEKRAKQDDQSDDDIKQSR